MSWWKKLLKRFCKWRIERTYFNCLSGNITAEEAEETRFFWHTMIVKWVRGECHHLCKFCDYKIECWSNAKE